MQTPYKTEVRAWAHEQAALMCSGQLAALDIEHLAEELETLGASQRRELKNRLTVRFAAKETGIPERLFPTECPINLALVLTEYWLPPDATDRA